MSRAKTAESIKMPRGMQTPLSHGNHVLDPGTYGRLLATTIERYVLSLFLLWLLANIGRFPTARLLALEDQRYG